MLVASSGQCTRALYYGFLDYAVSRDPFTFRYPLVGISEEILETLSFTRMRYVLDLSIVTFLRFIAVRKVVRFSMPITDYWMFLFTHRSPVAYTYMLTLG